MSSQSIPITAARFAEAIQDLPLSTLHLTVLELRNSIAHLDYSNEQLRPFAEGRERVLNPSNPSSSSADSTTPCEPDQDCLDAIMENESVISRMTERIMLIKAEVEGRGQSWEEFKSGDEVAAPAASAASRTPAETNGTSEPALTATDDGVGNETQRGAWSHETFQTGVIRNVDIMMNPQGNSSSPVSEARLTNEELSQRVEEQMRDLGNDEDDHDSNQGGLHL